MKGRDLKLAVGPFSAELAQRVQAVKIDEVAIFHEKIGGHLTTMIVSNRKDGLRIMVFYPDGGVLEI